jgi:hypothetical protein
VCGHTWNGAHSLQSTQEQIEKDLLRTFPNHSSMDTEGCAALRRLLNAYACHNSRVGYCQGMNFLAGVLLLFMHEEDAFWALDVLVEGILKDYFVEDMSGALLDQLVCKELLQQHFPTVMQHTEQLQVDLCTLVSQWCGP